MEISNRPFPPLTSGGNPTRVPLPASDTPPPPLTDEQKAAAQLLRDKLNEAKNPPAPVTPTKTSLIDEVV